LSYFFFFSYPSLADKFDMMGLVIVTLSLITVIGTLSVALPLIYAQTNEGEGQIAEFNETQEKNILIDNVKR
jgi:hypothetical protein